MHNYVPCYTESFAFIMRFTRIVSSLSAEPYKCTAVKIYCRTGVYPSSPPYAIPAQRPRVARK